MTWASRRQITYFLVFMTIILIIVGIPLYSVFHKVPTCSDQKQNGSEQGVDCGGACTRLCLALLARPLIQWNQAFEVDTGMYSGVAYIQNPNVSAQATNVPYVFQFLDEKNTVLQERKGTVYIPPGKNFTVFESNVAIPKSAGPIHTHFAFSADPQWLKITSELPKLSISNQVVEGISKSPSVNADIENTSNTNLKKVNVTAIVYDSQGNPVAASRTYIENLDRNSSDHVVFTWPRPFAGQVTGCAQSTDVVLDIDRSGSMASDNKNPPEPLTTVKQAALSFIDTLKKNDQAAIISFATSATTPLDQILTPDRDEAKQAIQNIAIGKGSTQYTNIYDAIVHSVDELMSSRHADGSKKSIVLLTDGKPTNPTQTGVPTYPSDKALAAARDAQARGVEIYTIGLGKEIDDNFMTALAGLPERYFKAPASSDLVSIYAKIGAALCKLGPAKVELISDIQPL